MGLPGSLLFRRALFENKGWQEDPGPPRRRMLFGPLPGVSKGSEEMKVPQGDALSEYLLPAYGPGL